MDSHDEEDELTRSNQILQGYFARHNHPGNGQSKEGPSVIKPITRARSATKGDDDSGDTIDPSAHKLSLRDLTREELSSLTKEELIELLTDAKLRSARPSRSPDVSSALPDRPRTSSRRRKELAKTKSHGALKGSYSGYNSSHGINPSDSQSEQPSEHRNKNVCMNPLPPEQEERELPESEPESSPETQRRRKQQREAQIKRELFDDHHMSSTDASDLIPRPLRPTHGATPPEEILVEESSSDDRPGGDKDGAATAAHSESTETANKGGLSIMERLRRKRRKHKKSTDEEDLPPRDKAPRDKSEKSEKSDKSPLRKKSSRSIRRKQDKKATSAEKSLELNEPPSGPLSSRSLHPPSTEEKPSKDTLRSSSTGALHRRSTTTIQPRPAEDSSEDSGPLPAPQFLLDTHHIALCEDDDDDEPEQERSEPITGARRASAQNVQERAVSPHSVVDGPSTESSPEKEPHTSARDVPTLIVTPTETTRGDAAPSPDNRQMEPSPSLPTPQEQTVLPAKSVEEESDEDDDSYDDSYDEDDSTELFTAQPVPTGEGVKSPARTLDNLLRLVGDPEEEEDVPTVKESSAPLPSSTPPSTSEEAPGVDIIPEYVKRKEERPDDPCRYVEIKSGAAPPKNLGGIQIESATGRKIKENLEAQKLRRYISVGSGLNAQVSATAEEDPL